MRHEKNAKKSISFYYMLCFAGCLILVLSLSIGFVTSKSKAEDALERTFNYMKKQCVSYDEVMTFDEVKSLIRLTEQVVEISDDLQINARLRSDAYLKQYAQRHRLSGIVVLNDKLSPAYEYYGADFSFDDIKPLAESSSISAILTYPKKIYVQRTTVNGRIFDIAAAVRSDSKGIIICLRIQKGSQTDEYRASLEKLLAGYETILDGILFITDGKKIVGSNVEKVHGTEVTDCPIITKLDASGKNRKLVRISDEGTSYYGACAATQKYMLYVAYPVSSIFSTGMVIVIISVGIYVIVLLIAVLSRNRTHAEYEKKLEETTKKAVEANNAKTDFLRRMSHDIRTPINVILGMLEISEKTPRDNFEKISYCRAKTREAAQFLLEIVNDVLTINKLESGKEIEECEPFSLQEEVAKVCSIIEVQAENRGVTLQTPDMQMQHDIFEGNSLHLGQIILNILNNAVKYSKKGGSIKVSFSEKIQDENLSEICFICEDNGIGMSKEFQEHMFEPFLQEADEMQTIYGGIGLGLSVVKKLVDKMQGNIFVESKKDKGTKIEITFKIKPLESARIEDEPTEQSDIRGVSVLLIEDNELNAEIAEFILKENGAGVTKAFNGLEGFEKFKASQPGEFDIILMDMMMPVMNGLECTKNIRALERSDAKTIPIFAMTANLFAEDIKMCMEAGMNEYLSKPLQSQKLLELVAKYMQKGRNKDENTGIL